MVLYKILEQIISHEESKVWYLNEKLKRTRQKRNNNFLLEK